MFAASLGALLADSIDYTSMFRPLNLPRFLCIRAARERGGLKVLGPGMKFRFSIFQIQIRLSLTTPRFLPAGSQELDYSSNWVW